MDTENTSEKPFISTASPSAFSDKVAKLAQPSLFKIAQQGLRIVVTYIFPLAARYSFVNQRQSRRGRQSSPIHEKRRRRPSQCNENVYASEESYRDLRVSE
jgi:hypothetical protein